MSEQTQWPIYKGPIKVPFRKRDRLYPERIGRHGSIYEPKHKGSEKPYELYLGHYEPKHKRRNYRYAKDGSIRKVLPRSATSNPTQIITPRKQNRMFKDAQNPPPPRTLLLHKYNDRFEQRFSLTEYRAKREPLTWTQRVRTFNYFREGCMVEGILVIIAILFVIQESLLWQRIGTLMMITLLILFPITALNAVVHHVRKDRK